MTPLRRGDFVQLTIEAWHMRAMVTLASPNGRSIIVMFDGAAPLGSVVALGMMPLFQDDDGTWHELGTRTPVQVLLDNRRQHDT